MNVNPRWANYFDNAATTPLDPRVLEAMLPYLCDEFGNAHSIHQWGHRASAAVEKAREQIHLLIGADNSSQIVFTSGATESNNTLLGFEFLQRGENGLTEFEEPWISPFEHSSLFELRHRNSAISILPNSGIEILQPVGQCDSIFCMWVNNEIGTIFPVLNLKLAENWGKLHSDITQAIGKVECSVEHLDYASMSAHKIHGPKGVGATFDRQSHIDPLLIGGEQEGDHRAGTVNVAGIVGFGAAAEIAIDERSADHSKAELLQSAIFDELSIVSDWQVNGGNNRSPFILSISLLNVEGESLVIEADNAGFAISAGAACSSRSTEPSHVLTALGLEPEWIRGTIRISFGRFNTVEAAAKLGKTLAKAVERLRSMRS